MLLLQLLHFQQHNSLPGLITVCVTVERWSHFFQQTTYYLLQDWKPIVFTRKLFVLQSEFFCTAFWLSTVNAIKVEYSLRDKIRIWTGKFKVKKRKGQFVDAFFFFCQNICLLYKYCYNNLNPKLTYCTIVANIYSSCLRPLFKHIIKDVFFFFCMFNVVRGLLTEA